MNIQRFWLIWVFVFFILGGCMPAPVASISNPEDMIATIAAATIAALPTNTPMPTSTQTARPTRLLLTQMTPTPFVSVTPFPTFTQFPTLTEKPTDVGSAAQQGVYQGTDNYGCMIMNQNPVNWSKFRPGTLIYATWAVKNVGALEWKKDHVKIVRESGEKIEVYGKTQELTFSVKPGEIRNILIVVRAPEKRGAYHITFGLQRGGDVFCRMIMGMTVR